MKKEHELDENGKPFKRSPSPTDNNNRWAHKNPYDGRHIEPKKTDEENSKS